MSELRSYYNTLLQIILGLVTHEPYISLLREEVRFDKKVGCRLRNDSHPMLTISRASANLATGRSRRSIFCRSASSANTSTWSSIRFVYAATDDCPIHTDVPKGQIKFAYDFEQLLDDWVLIGFLVGNDFLPNLPHFHIGEVASRSASACPLNALTGYPSDALGRLQEGSANARWIHADRYESA